MHKYTLSKVLLADSWILIIKSQEVTPYDLKIERLFHKTPYKYTELRSYLLDINNKISGGYFL